MASKSSSLNEPPIGIAGRASNEPRSASPHGHAAAPIGRPGRSPDEPAPSSPHSHAAAGIGRGRPGPDEPRSSSPHSRLADLTQPGSSLSDHSRRLSGPEDPATQLAGLSGKTHMEGALAKHFPHRASGNSQKVRTAAGRSSLSAKEKGSLGRATPQPAGLPSAHQGPVLQQPLPKAQRPTAQHGAVAESRHSNASGQDPAAEGRQAPGCARPVQDGPPGSKQSESPMLSNAMQSPCRL